MVGLQLPTYSIKSGGYMKQKPNANNEMMKLESELIACSGCRQVYPVGRVVKVGSRNFCYGCFSVAEATGLIEAA